MIAPPQYVVTTQTMERTEGLEMLNKAIEAIKSEITAAGGVFNIQQQVNDFKGDFFCCCFFPKEFNKCLK